MDEIFQTNDLLIATYLCMVDTEDGITSFMGFLPNVEESSDRTKKYFTFENRPLQKERPRNLDPRLTHFFTLFHTIKRQLNGR